MNMALPQWGAPQLNRLHLSQKVLLIQHQHWQAQLSKSWYCKWPWPSECLFAYPQNHKGKKYQTEVQYEWIGEKSAPLLIMDSEEVDVDIMTTISSSPVKEAAIVFLANNAQRRNHGSLRNFWTWLTSIEIWRKLRIHLCGLMLTERLTRKSEKHWTWIEDQCQEI